jgi:hypothetical protein
LIMPIQRIPRYVLLLSVSVIKGAKWRIFISLSITSK